MTPEELKPEDYKPPVRPPLPTHCTWCRHRIIYRVDREYCSYDCKREHEAHVE